LRPFIPNNNPMKKLTYLGLTLVSISFLGAVALADDMTITIKKSSDTTAKVEAVAPDKGGPVVVPISFDSGADWDAVKDTYTVSPDTAKCLLKKKETISIGTDGTATFHSKK
jgi:hypothetical protein